MVSVGGNLYSVPDATRKRVVEVHTLADEVRIFEDGALIAAHPVLEGSNQRRVAPGHRKMTRIADPQRGQNQLVSSVVWDRELGRRWSGALLRVATASPCWRATPSG
jgi:hypothetical protein